MTSTPNDHNLNTPPLPQYGFGADIDFDTLAKVNHFLFRVYRPRNRHDFFARKFDERYHSPEEILQQSNHTDHSIYTWSYNNVAEYMNWVTRSSSPYIPLSFSYIWSIWEALRRYHLGVKKDVEIAVIDATAVANRAKTIVQVLRNSLPSERRTEHWKWYKFAMESQTVLVYEQIPASAVLASVPLISIIEKLPSYFLRSQTPTTMKLNPLSALGWDYTQRKQSYWGFCSTMSRRFLQLSPEARSKDATVASVQLAMSFLRPWFHRSAAADVQAATSTLRDLAVSIALWPGQWWVQEHSEARNIINAMSASLAEEVQSSQRGRELAEITQVMAGLEDIVRASEAGMTAKVTAWLQRSQGSSSSHSLDIINAMSASLAEEVQLSQGDRKLTEIMQTMAELEDIVRASEVGMTAKVTAWVQRLQESRSIHSLGSSM